MIAIEITMAIDAAGTTKKFYVSDSQLVTSPSDTPANTAFINCAIDPGSINISAYSDFQTGGESEISKGAIELANSDGQLDSWLNYSVDGRSIVIRQGVAGTAYPSAWTTLFVGTGASIESTVKLLKINLRDYSFVFSPQLQSTLYGGTNALPNGVDGTPNDIMGQPKPRIYGKVKNVTPVFVNTSKLIYQISDRALSSIDAVYDGAVALTAGADFATNALLQAAAPGAGTFITCLAEGMFRLGSAPTYQITADATQGAAAANRTVAQILKQMALDAGVASGSIYAADVTALDTANSSVVGIYINDTTSFADNMNKVAASIGVWYGFDITGSLRMGQLLAPTGTPVYALQTLDAIKDIDRVTPKNVSIPVWQVNIQHSQNYTVQTSGLGGSATAAQRAFVGIEFRNQAASDATVKTQYLLAGIMNLTALFSDSSAATNALAEANRQLTLQKTRRDVFSIPVDLSVAKTILASDNKGLMAVVSFTYNRFGLNSGKLFRVLGINMDLAKNIATLVIWG